MGMTVQVGDLVAGKFRIERVLGAGGMGIVVAARHIHLDERVAIKLLRSDALHDEELVTRFLKEARTTAKVRSEHIARIYDVGTLDDGAPYLVMEYLDGCDLAAALKQHGPLPVEIAVEYALHICEALAEAHALGIVHRDLKPANVFVTTRSDGSPVIKVIDFGISKVITGPEGGIDMTKTAEIRGTPLFMSPEQMRNPRGVDARTDIWSLGVTLHNLLSGSFPFHAQSVIELCAKIFQDEPTPLRRVRLEVPAALESAVLRCLRKNPDGRFADVAEVAGAIAMFAPAGAQIFAERAARILYGGERRSRSSLPSVSLMDSAPVSLPRWLAPEHEPPSTPDVGRSSSPTARPVIVAQTTVMQEAGRKWDKTQRLFQRPKRLITAASIAGVLLLGASISLIALRSQGVATPAQEPAALPTGPIPEAAASTAEPSVDPAVPLPPDSSISAQRDEPVAVPSSAPSPTLPEATARASAPPASKPPTSRVPVARPAGVSTPKSVSAKPTKDLWGTRK